MKTPSPRQLEYFLALADTLSFSKAADVCHVTQSTLSNGLIELENTLNQRLFDRGTRRVSLTPAGEDLIAPSRSILEQLDNLVHLAQTYRAPLSGRMVLGIIPTIAPYILPKLLPQQQISYPDLDLHLREDVTARQLEDLKKGKTDIVLMAFPYDTPALDRQILWREPFFLASPKKRGQPRTIGLDELKAHKILLLEDGHCLREHVISACRLPVNQDKLPSSMRTSLGATSLQTLVQMVQHGYGATLLPEMAVQKDQIPKGIAIQSFDDPVPFREIGLVWRKHDPRSPDFRLLGDLIRQSCMSHTLAV